MTRSLFLVAAALMLSASLPVDRTAAQEAASDTSAEASAESSQADADASADASGSAEAQQSDAQADASGSAEAQQSDTQADASATESSSTSETTSDNQATDSASPSLPPPSTDADADADASATDRQTQPESSDRAEADATQRTEAQTDEADAPADASTRGRADVDARIDRDGQRDMRDDRRDMREGRRDMRRGIHFGRRSNRGLTISNVERSSIYFHSGFRNGDVIISLHGRPIRNESDFWVAVRRGERVPVVVLRDGREETIYVEYPDEVVYADQPYDDREVHAGGQAYLGVVFDGRARDAAIVRSIEPGSPAEQAGLQRGDMIVALNDEAVRTYQDAIAIIRSMQPGDRVNIAFARRMEADTEAVLGSQPGEPVRTATREPEIRVERRVETEPDDRRLDVDRRDVNRRRDLDRDRDEDDARDRGLLRRLFD